jgi:hypothetical protein
MTKVKKGRAGFYRAEMATLEKGVCGTRYGIYCMRIPCTATKETMLKAEPATNGIR